LKQIKLSGRQSVCYVKCHILLSNGCQPCWVDSLKSNRRVNNSHGQARKGEIGRSDTELDLWLRRLVKGCIAFECVIINAKSFK